MKGKGVRRAAHLNDRDASVTAARAQFELYQRRVGGHSVPRHGLQARHQIE